MKNTGRKIKKKQEVFVENEDIIKEQNDRAFRKGNRKLKKDLPWLTNRNI